VRREGANQLVCDVGGATVHACDPGSVQPGERVTLAIRPESVAVSVAGDREGQANVFTGVLAAREYGGGVEHVTVDVAELGASVLCEVAARGECRPSDGSVGDPVGVCFRREDVIVVADGGAVSSDGDGVAPGLPAATVA
jgi:ABC-type Fe3+/spermidine/putrescine transport system ATPase subunit